MAEFNFGDFTKLFPDGVAEALKDEGYNSLPALLCASSEDIGALNLKRGHIGIVRQAVMELQSKYGRGPLLEAQSPPGSSKEAGLESLSKLLGNLTTGRSAAETDKGQCLRVVDFVPTSMLLEDEVSLGGGVSLKINAKPKLEKISPAMWISANAKILTRMVTEDPAFNHNVVEYLAYNDMIGELAARFTWTSVVAFDDEYRQRQAAQKFKWGTPAPHLSTVVLREKPNNNNHINSNSSNQGKKSGGGRRPVGASGKELCLQFNRATCNWGPQCKYDHACITCGSKDHGSKDHTTTTTTATLGGQA
jgi:hypothetical protein